MRPSKGQNLIATPLLTMWGGLSTPVFHELGPMLG